MWFNVPWRFQLDGRKHFKCADCRKREHTVHGQRFSPYKMQRLLCGPGSPLRYILFHVTPAAQHAQQAFWIIGCPSQISVAISVCLRMNRPLGVCSDMCKGSILHIPAHASMFCNVLSVHPQVCVCVVNQWQRGSLVTRWIVRLAHCHTCA